MAERWTVRFNPKTGEKYFMDDKGNTSIVKPKGYEEPEKIPAPRGAFFSVGRKEYQLKPALSKEEKSKRRLSPQPPPKGGVLTSRNDLGEFNSELVDSEKDLRKKKDKKVKKVKNEETDMSAVWDNLKGDSSGVNLLDPETGKLKKKKKQKKKKDDKELVMEYAPDEEVAYQEIRTSKYAAGAPPRAASSAVLNTVKKPETPDYLMAANFVPKLTALDAVPHEPTVWDGKYLNYRDWTFWDMFVHEKKKTYKGSTFFKWTLFAHNVGFIASLCLIFFGTVAVFWDFRLDTGILPPGTEDLMVVNGFVGFYSLGVGAVLFVFEKLYGLNKTLFIDGSCGYIRGLFYIGLSIPTFSSYATIMTGLLCILAGVLNFIATYSKEKGKARGPKSYLFEFFEWEAERGTYIVAMLFIFVNVLVFMFSYIKFEFIRLRCVRDSGDAAVDLCPSSFAAVAKGFGNNLNFDCALIILPVSRNVLTIVTEKVNKSNSFPIRKAVEFHQIIAAVVAIAAIGHTIAHYVNYTFVADATIKGFGFFAWYTGAAICLVMGVLFGAAHSVVRKANYELFWYTHHTYSLFFLLLLAHGPFFYQWFFIPILVFAYEKISRHRARLRRKVLVRSVEYIQPVLNINFSFAENFEFREGQYVYLLVPQVNSWQWHPFSISSSNGDLEKFGYMSLHIRVQDDELSWTYGLKEYFKLIAGAGDKPKDAAFFSDNFHYYDSTGKFQKGLHHGPDGRPLIKIDGAYNSPTQVYNSYRDVILVGSGIGLTPSAGILRAILRYKWAKGFFPDTVRFAWVLRQSEVLSFTWFIEMLVDLMARVKSDREGNNLTENHFIQVNIYVTGTKVDKNEVEETKKDKKKKRKKDREEKKPDVNELRTTVKKMFQLAGRRSFIGVERLESTRGPKERLGERRLLEDDVDVFNSGIMKGSKEILGFDSQNIFEQILSPRVSSDEQKNILPTSMTAENRMGDIFIWNGRPDWDAVFWQARDSAMGRNEKVGLIKQRLKEGADYGQIKEEFDYDVDQEGLSLTSDIGVCFCGSSLIGHDLAVATKKYSTRKLEFHLNQEFF